MKTIVRSVRSGSFRTVKLWQVDDQTGKLHELAAWPTYHEHSEDYAKALRAAHAKKASIDGA